MTAATAALAPGPLITGPGPGATADDTTTTRADFGRWEREFAADSGCSHPIQLRSRTDMIDLATGELAPLYGTAVRARAATAARPSARPARRSTSGTPGSSSARAWPEARASPRRSPRTRACSPPSPPPPSARSTPAGCAARPCCPAVPAATPSARRCPHGRDISCPTRHVEADPRLGQPMCPDCYDYEAAVLFNAYAADLWRRFVTYLPRHLARLAGRHPEDPARPARGIRFVKVAEYQARGVVHFHAVIRLDAPGEDYQPPPPGFTAALLCEAIDQAAAAVRIVIDHHGQAVRARLRPADRHAGSSGTAPTCPAPARPLNGQAVANYIAKYATKTLTRPRPARLPAPPPGRHRPAALLGPLPADDHHRLAARRRRATGRTGSGPGRTCSATAATS